MKDLASHANVRLHVPSTIATLQSIIPEKGDVFLLDDLSHMTSETQQLMFIQWYNSLPAMCKIIAISNYGPNSINPFSSIYRRCINL